MSRRRNNVTYSIPDLGCKYILLPFDNEFVFYQNGNLFSLKTGAFIKKQITNHGVEFYSIRNGQLKKTHTFVIEQAIKVYFHNQLPQNGCKHSTIKDFPNYQLYSNGRVWSKKNFIWLKGATTNTSYFVTLVNENGPQTFYPNNHLNEYFGEE